MGLFDKLKGKQGDEDDAIALGVATGTPAEIWAADGDRDAEGDVEPAAASDALRIVDEADPLTRLDMGGIPSPERGQRARIFGNGPRIGGRSMTGRS